MSENKGEIIGKIRLEGRLSFPKIFKAEAVQKGQEPKFSCNLLLDKKKDAKQIQLIRDTIEVVKKKKWGDNIPKGIKLCLHEGSEKEEFDGYDESVMYLTSSNARRPDIRGRGLEILTAEDGRPYAGCYVKLVVILWAQDNEYGKRINSELHIVQFVRDGEEFSGKPKISAEDELTSLEDDEDDLG